MTERKRVFILIFIMAFISLIVTGLTILTLYRTAIMEERERLVETAQSQARLIESVTRFDAIYSKSYSPGGARAATLTQIVEAHKRYEQSGMTVEFTLAKRKGDSIIFLLRHRYGGLEHHLKPISFDSKLAEPMRQALSGHSGTLIGLDYRGEKVLAAHEPVSELDLGIVAKIDLSEIRAPFIKAGLIAGIIAIVFVVAGATLFRRITYPMIMLIEEHNAELSIANKNLRQQVNERKRAEDKLQKAHDELETRVKERTVELSESNALLIQENGERSQVEEALKQSEKRYRMVSELTSDFAYAFGVDQAGALSFEWATEALDRITGFTVDELRMRGGWESIIYPDDLPIIGDQLKHLIDGQPNIVQYRIITSKGIVRWLLDFGRPEWDKKQGRVIYIFGAVQDITERKQAENKLQESEQKYRLLVENANEGIAVAQDGFLKFVNPKMIEMFGYSEPDLTSRPFLDFVHPDSQKIAIEHHSRKIEKPEIAETYNVKIIDKSGKVKWIENNGIAIDWEGEPGTLNFLTDITERRLFERHLIQKEKLASLGVLVSSIAHEINNPNNFISFNIPILRDYINELIPIIEENTAGCAEIEICHLKFSEFRQDIFKLLDNLENGSSRISAFVSNLRDFSQNKDMKSRIWVELKDVIERVLSICNSNIKSSVKSFVKTVPEDLPSVCIEPYALEQILLNLLINATQAVRKKDSCIKLIVSVVDGRQDQFCIEVTDNGCGMDEETQLKIFDPFFTTKAHMDGTGLGLYICHSMAERLNGRIELESEPGTGSTFKLILPVENKN
jgi:PAS domain S-box-containing protein